MISKIIQRECYIPDDQIKNKTDKAINSSTGNIGTGNNDNTDNTYSSLETICIENIFNNDFDFPGPCIDDFSSKTCPNTRIVVYKNTDISNNSCKDHFNRRIIYRDKYELYRKLERSFQKKRISINRWIQKKEKRFLTPLRSTMICYPDNDHKYKVNITGGIVCYKCFKTFINYFAKHDLVVLFTSQVTIRKCSSNTIIIKLTKSEIEKFITKYYCNREYFNSYRSVRIIVNISDGIAIPINFKKALYLLYQYVDIKRRFTWFYYNNTPSYRDLTRIEYILPFVITPLYYPLTVSTYHLLVKVIGNFISNKSYLQSLNNYNSNKIHYVSLTKNEKMNLVQYQQSGIGKMDTNFSLRKYEVQDFCGKIKREQLCLPQMIYNKGELLGKLSTQKECPICLQDIKEYGITVCGHVFCYECISLCIKQGLCCPHCRNKNINYQNTFKVVKNKPDTVIFQLTEYQSSYLRSFIGSKLCFLLQLLENISTPVIIVSDHDTTVDKISDLFLHLQIPYSSGLNHSSKFKCNICQGEQLYQYYLTSIDLNTDLHIIFMESTIYSKWFLNNSQRYSTKCKIHLLDLMVN